MPESRFISGALKIAVSFIDRKDQYKVKVCRLGGVGVAGKQKCETVFVGLPGQGYSTSAHGRKLAVDDPRAFRQAAAAGIAFSSHNMQEYADFNRRGSGYVIRPLRRKRR